MTTRGVRIAAAIAATALALTACGGSDQESDQDRHDRQASAAVAAIATDTSWVPVGMTQVGDVAWKWTDKSQYECKIYQDGGCWGVTVTPRSACPNGVYIEIAVLEDGVAVGKANEITAGLGAEQTARAVLAPPGGSAADARARVTKLNCLGG